jgi:hypothetical protein
MFRKLRGKYKLRRILAHYGIEMDLFTWWGGEMCPANEQRRKSLIDASTIIINRLRTL